MEWHVSNWWVLLNIIVQIINLVVFFLIFRKLFASKIVEAFQQREVLLAKIKNAEAEYQQILSDAHSQARDIIEDAVNHKKLIITEAEDVANQEKLTIIWNANKKADEIIKNANLESNRLKAELEENWITWVKNTAKLIVKKLIQSNPQIQDQYIDVLINEVKKS